MKRKLIGVSVVVGWATLSLGGGYLAAVEVFGFEHPASQVFATLGGSFVIGCVLTAMSKALRK